MSKSAVASEAADPMAPLAAALLPFQREGVAAGLRWRGRMLLGDEMGLGKTLQATSPDLARPRPISH